MSHKQVCQNLCEGIRDQDPDGHKAAKAFRDAFDYVYNGAATGRFHPDSLSKTESAHIGSLVEINLRREFDGFITDGLKMDFSIQGHDVDCKYSKSPFGWTIPLETIGNYAMVCHASDSLSTWKLGFVYIDETILNKGKNRDMKTTIRSAARDQIVWAWLDQPLPENVLLHLDPETVDLIMSPKSGQQRVNNLFKYAQNREIPRGVIETVAQQKDYMKRVRGNGGARSRLQNEGIIILGGYQEHQDIAKNLGLPIPKSGSFVSTRVSPANHASDADTAMIGSSWWRLSTDDDPITPAPALGNPSRKSPVESELQNEQFGQQDKPNW